MSMRVVGVGVVQQCLWPSGASTCSQRSNEKTRAGQGRGGAAPALDRKQRAGGARCGQSCCGGGGGSSHSSDIAAPAFPAYLLLTTEPWRAGAPVLTNPTRRTATPSASCCRMTCDWFEGGAGCVWVWV